MPTMYGKPYVALFPLCFTDWESRIAVNNKTAHCKLGNTRFVSSALFCSSTKVKWRIFDIVSIPGSHHMDKEDFQIGMSVSVCAENPRSSALWICRVCKWPGWEWQKSWICFGHQSRVKTNGGTAQVSWTLLRAFCVLSYIHLPRVLLAYSPTFK